MHFLKIKLSTPQTIKDQKYYNKLNICFYFFVILVGAIILSINFTRNESFIKRYTWDEYKTMNMSTTECKCTYPRIVYSNFISIDEDTVCYQRSDEAQQMLCSISYYNLRTEFKTGVFVSPYCEDKEYLEYIYVTNFYKIVSNVYSLQYSNAQMNFNEIPTLIEKKGLTGSYSISQDYLDLQLWKFNENYKYIDDIVQDLQQVFTLNYTQYQHFCQPEKCEVLYQKTFLGVLINSGGTIFAYFGSMMIVAKIFLLFHEKNYDKKKNEKLKGQRLIELTPNESSANNTGIDSEDRSEKDSEEY
ncbi:hypothetical protein M0812_09767 [Anaeramoeba flamelloides]|uniref:Transmembrane protein n=1 Tax=Anaeramoeba flamelloides TaxID=1746091 RepID=A0AAV7ZVI3_9EUKA|nr:hypothetical protein M0812_09767 [Anaeramoeba flamelloides]